jgi:hypothetical protein
MHTHQKSYDPVATIGLDIEYAPLVGLDKGGTIVVRIKLSRNQLVRRLVKLAPCLLGLEAGCGAHHNRAQIMSQSVLVGEAADGRKFVITDEAGIIDL